MFNPFYYTWHQDSCTFTHPVTMFMVRRYRLSFLLYLIIHFILWKGCLLCCACGNNNASQQEMFSSQVITLDWTIFFLTWLIPSTRKTFAILTCHWIHNYPWHLLFCLNGPCLFQKYWNPFVALFSSDLGMEIISLLCRNLWKIYWDLLSKQGVKMV